MTLKAVILLVGVLFTVSCSSVSKSGNSEGAESALLICQSELKKIISTELFEQVDNVYVHKFSAGYTVLFSHGAVGTFGKRSQKKSIGSCSLADWKIVTAENHSSPSISGESIDEVIEDYSQDVKEYLFVREGDDFKFCCMQNFNEANIYKHNPGFFDNPKNQRTE